MSSAVSGSTISGKDRFSQEKEATINGKKVILKLTFPKQPVFELFCKVTEKTTDKEFRAHITRLNDTTIVIKRLDTNEQSQFIGDFSGPFKILKTKPPTPPLEDVSDSEDSDSDSDDEMNDGGALTGVISGSAGSTAVASCVLQ